MRLHMIIGFNNNLPCNFNHLMYTDDLVIITKAFGKMTYNCETFISIYPSFTWKNPNISKSIIFFPNWFNERVAKSISNILKFKISNHLYAYLGISISLKKLHVSLQGHD